mmetsp:Transcript_16711/g.35892  ORF Transcript_16711/g.35892 Transcript_16711/m.35892 type:complete len:214 (-) Transcript_16711:89-730(-)|eukprot:CAMPEP_0206452076 /NCGR_PEP_ID=MMETSP0324_2-20121206/19729_1 /ASSEMBLY_ACC=CAM_ASM_000836 /TAXON_ID=2866 /ORGANISM="Crypthecodinium cohnii, Strain Seligo" /LENGTH=213 /DNA_ID=CAMNT_0053922095 /DNA_START=147 /DNA_END=788 /DNA_ORIENTATION=+
MSKDYYATLGVARTATGVQIREGFRRVALKWHPQRNPGAKTEAELRFREIAEAYDVLVDPLRRRVYDDLGEKGLKFPPANADREAYQYVGDPFGLFEKFFADANPLAVAYEEDYEGHAPGLDPKDPDESIEVVVPCAAAELLDGSCRRVTVKRTRLGAENKPYVEEKLITMPIRQGWQSGMRVTFRGEGHHTTPKKQPGDLILIIEERPFAEN